MRPGAVYADTASDTLHWQVSRLFLSFVEFFNVVFCRIIKWHEAAPFIMYSLSGDPELSFGGIFIPCTFIIKVAIAKYNGVGGIPAFIVIHSTRNPICQWRLILHQPARLHLAGPLKGGSVVTGMFTSVAMRLLPGTKSKDHIVFMLETVFSKGWSPHTFYVQPGLAVNYRRWEADCWWCFISSQSVLQTQCHEVLFFVWKCFNGMFRKLPMVFYCA